MRQLTVANRRDGSFASIPRCTQGVRFTPDNGHVSAAFEAQASPRMLTAVIARMERLSLLQKQVGLDTVTKLPEFDNFTGEAKGNHVVTSLGRLVLSRTGLAAACI
jgi:hypothetical protein